MRQLPKRSKLPKELETKFGEETLKITTSGTPKDEAENTYTAARKAAWFRPVVQALAKLSGTGERCMYCSGSESSDVEHYRPKSTFPDKAMTWENYLWICTPCNRSKSNQFPFLPDGSPALINPLDQNVWAYFYIDEFGNLSKRWDAKRDDFFPEGTETEKVIGLDRQALQESRRTRMDDLKEKVTDAMKLLKSGDLSVAAAKRRVRTWRKQPYQPDVADYFLNGPGKAEKPFAGFFRLLSR